MSWQKFKKVIHLKLCHLRDKTSNCNLRYTKSQEQSFLNGFYASVSQNEKKNQLKRKLTNTKI